MIIKPYEDKDNNKRGYIIDSVNYDDDFPIKIWSDYEHGISHKEAIKMFTKLMRSYFKEAWDEAFKD